MGRTVLLRHALPDGSVHWDWLIQPPDAATSDPVPTFRLEHSFANTPGADGIRAERIADHRPMYLDYEGPVSRNRGMVRRVWEGRVLALDASDDRLVCAASACCGACTISADRAMERGEREEWFIRVEHHRR